MSIIKIGQFHQAKRDIHEILISFLTGILFYTDI